MTESLKKEKSNKQIKRQCQFIHSSGHCWLFSPVLQTVFTNCLTQKSWNPVWDCQYRGYRLHSLFQNPTVKIFYKEHSQVHGLMILCFILKVEKNRIAKLRGKMISHVRINITYKLWIRLLTSLLIIISNIIRIKEILLLLL